MNELHDACVEAMMDALPYRFKDIDEWNAFRDRLFDAIETLNPAQFTRAGENEMERNGKGTV